MRVFTAIAFLLFALFEIGSAIGYATLMTDQARILDRAAFQFLTPDEIRFRLALQVVVPAVVGLALLPTVVALLKRSRHAGTIAAVSASFLLAHGVFQAARPSLHGLPGEQATAEYMLAALLLFFGVALMGAGRTAARLKPKRRKGGGDGAPVQVVDGAEVGASAEAR